MTQVSETQGTLYDAFAGPAIDTSKWAILDVPLGPDQVWHCAEPSARESVGNGVAEIRVDRFERAGQGVQLLDNPKHLYFSTESFGLPSHGVARFSVEMAAENVNGQPLDYRDGFAGFVTADFNTLIILDHIATSARQSVLYERLFIPGMIERAETFTYVVDSPLAGIFTQPGAFHRYAIDVDTPNAEARWWVDGHLVFVAPRLPEVPTEMKLGFGLFTLRDYEDGQSVSLRGQGMTGRWRNFRVAI